MIDYEISFPDCPMIEQERMTNIYGRTALGHQLKEHIQNGTVAHKVMDDTDRDCWCSIGHQESVDAVLALVRYTSNSKGFRKTLLREAYMQLCENRLPDFWIRKIDMPDEYRENPRYEQLYVRESEPQITEHF